MVTKTSAKPMLSWQYRGLLAELSQITMHSISEDCPCNQVDLDPPEYCLGKHLLNVSSLASETELMDETNADMLADLSSEALAHHEKAKTIYCKGGEWPELARWSRNWRKKIEGIYYACGAKLRQETQRSLTQGGQVVSRSPHKAEIVGSTPTPATKAVSITGRCGASVDTCQFTIRRKGKPHLITKEVETAKVTDPLLDTIAKELCTTGVCLATEGSHPLPVCTKSKAKKLERCILSVKAKGDVVNPFAVCQSQLGCKKVRA